VSVGSTLFRIELDDGGVELEFHGWVSVDESDDADLRLTLVRDFQ
jgi:hypothetical protein